MCMSYNHLKPIRMHALTLFNDMRRSKLPQRPRGSPWAFTFFKISEHTETNQYTPLPTLAPILSCPSWPCARRQRHERRFKPLHSTGLRRAPPPVGNSLPRQFVSPDLSGNFVSLGIFFWKICVTRVAALPVLVCSGSTAFFFSKMLNKTTAAPENHRPWRWYRVGAPEEHLSGSVLLRSSTRVGAPEEPGSVLLRSWLLRSRVGDSQERPSPTYPDLGATRGTAVFGASDESYEGGAGVAWAPSGAPEGADLVLPSDLDENRTNCPSMP